MFLGPNNEELQPSERGRFVRVLEHYGVRRCQVPINHDDSVQFRV